MTNDHLGSPRIITDSSGTVLSRRDFLPFGEEAFAGTGNRAAGHGYTASGDTTRQKFTSYERDEETELDFAEARMMNYGHGRFTSPDPLYLEAKRLIDPQRFNLYIYTRNNPLVLIDPDGLDIKVKDKTKDKTGDEEYLKLLNTRKNQQFQLGYDKKNKLTIVDSKGNALGKEDLAKLGNSNLSDSEKELFNAVTDKDNHATVTIVRNDSKILTFGAYKGDGKNTIDVGDLAVLNSSNPSTFTASNVALHETLEAYTSARLGSGFNPAHSYVNQFFPGLETPTGGATNYSPDGTQVIGGTLTFPIHNGGGAGLDVTFEYVTPIPTKSLPKAKKKFRPFDITKTKENP